MHILNSLLEIMSAVCYLLKHLPSPFIIPPSDTAWAQILNKS